MSSDNVLLTLPAGSIEEQDGGNLARTAYRELHEEVGLDEDVIPLEQIAASPFRDLLNPKGNADRQYEVTATPAQWTDMVEKGNASLRDWDVTKTKKIRGVEVRKAADGVIPIRWEEWRRYEKACHDLHQEHKGDFKALKGPISELTVTAADGTAYKPRAFLQFHALDNHASRADDGSLITNERTDGQGLEGASVLLLSSDRSHVLCLSHVPKK